MGYASAIGLLFFVFIVMTHITRHVLNVEVDIIDSPPNDLILMVTQSYYGMSGSFESIYTIPFLFVPLESPHIKESPKQKSR